MYLNVKVKDIREKLSQGKLVYIEDFQKVYTYNIDKENKKPRYIALCQYKNHTAEIIGYVKTEEAAIEVIYDRYIEDMNRYLVALSDIEIIQLD